jgi:hypothetical protein
MMALSPYGATSSRYPATLASADAVLACRPPGEIVFNSFGLGGYLLWHHPHLTPVVDLRIEIYPWEHLESYLRARDAKPGWQESVQSTGASFALLSPDSKLIEALKRESWEVVADEPGGVLLSRPGLEIETTGACR